MDQIEKRLSQTRHVAAGMGNVMAGVFGGVGFAAFNKGLDGARAAAGGAKDALIGLNTSAENVRAQFLAFTKDSALTDQILAQVRTEADKTAFSYTELSGATASLIPSARQAREPLMDLLKTAEILAASHPEQGLAGAAFALREAISGDFTSIVERFDLPRSYINQLKEQGVPNIEIVRKAMLAMGYDADLVAKLGETMSGRWSTFNDTLDGIKMRLTRPLFDVLKAGLAWLQGWFDANKGTIDAWADRAGAAIGQFARSTGAWFQQWGPTVAATLVVVGQNAMQLAGLFASALGGVLNVVTTLGQLIYQGLQWINPFARHSPSLVEQVEGGVDRILAKYGELAGIASPLKAAGAAVVAFREVAKAGFDAYQESQRQATAQTLAVFGEGVPQAYLNATKAIETLQDALGPLQGRIAAQQGVVDDWESRVQAAQAAVDAKSRSIKELEQGLRPLEAAVIAAKDALSAQKERTDAAKEAVDALKAAIGDAKSRLQDWAKTPIEGTKAFQDALFATETEIARVQLALARWKFNPDVRAEVERLTAALAAQRGVVAEWQGRVEAAEGAVAAQRDRVREAEQSLSPYNDAVTAAKDAIAQQEAAVRRAEAGLRPFEAAVAAAKDAIEAQEGAVKRAEVALRPYDAAVTSAKDAIDAQEAAIRRAEVALRPYNDAVDTAKDAIAQQERRVRDAERAMGAFDTAVEGAKDALDTQKIAVTAAKDEVEALTGALRDAERRIKEFAQAPLEGSRAFQDQLFALDQQMAGIELQMTQLKLSEQPNLAAIGLMDQLDAAKREAQQAALALQQLKIARAPEEQIDAAAQSLAAAKANASALALQLDDVRVPTATAVRLGELGDQMDRLRLQAQQVRLQEQLELDPRRREIARAADDGGELSFNAIIAGIAAARAEQGRLTPLLAEATARYDEQRGALSGLEAALRTAETAREGQRAVIDAEKAALDPLRDTLAATEAARDAQRAAIEREKEALGALREALTAAEQAREGQRRAIDREKDALDPLRDALAAAEQAREGQRLAIQREKDALDLLREALGVVEAARDGQRRAIEAEKTALEDLQRQLTIEKEGLAGAKEGVAALQQQLEAAQEPPQALTERLKELQAQAEILKLDDRVNLEPLRRQLQDLATPLRELPFGVIVAGMAATQSEIADLEAQLGPATAAWQAEERALRDTEGALKAAEGARDAQRAVIDREQLALQDLRDTLDRTQEGYQAEKDALGRLQGQYQDITGQIREYERALKDVEAIAGGAKKGQEGIPGGPLIVGDNQPAGTNIFEDQQRQLDDLRKRYSDTKKEIEDRVNLWKERIKGYYDEASTVIGSVVGAVQSVLTAFRTGDFDAAFYPIFLAIDRVFGIQTALKVADFVRSALGHLGQVRAFVADTLLPALGKLWDYWEHSLLPTLRAFGGFVFNDLIPALIDFERKTGILEGTIKEIGKTIDSWAKLIRDTTNLVRENEGAQAVLVGTLTSLTTAFVLIRGAAIAHTVATTATTAAQWLLNAAMTANPIGIVVVALAGLAAGLVYAYKNSEDFRNIVDTVWAKLKEWGSAVKAFAWDVIHWFQEMYNKLVGHSIVPDMMRAIAGWFSWLWDEGKRIFTLIKVGIGVIWDEIKTNGADVWKIITSVLTGQWSEAFDAAERIFTRIRAFIFETWDKLKEKLAGSTIFQTLLVEPFERARDGLSRVVQTLSFNILNALQGGLDGVWSFVRGVRDAVNWISGHLGLGSIIPEVGNAPSLLGGFQNGAPSGAPGAMYAAGTAFHPGGPALVSEAGREFVKPSPAADWTLVEQPTLLNLGRGAQVVPNAATEALLAAGIPGFALGLNWDDIRDTIKSAGAGVLGFAREWLGKGAGALADAALKATGVEAPRLPGALRDIGGALLGKAQGWLVERVRGWLDAARAALPTPAGDALPGIRGVGWGDASPAAVDALLQRFGFGRSPFSGADIDRLSDAYGVPEGLILGLLQKESQIGSNAGALGSIFNFGGITASAEQIAAGQSYRHVFPGGETRDFLKFNAPAEYLDYTYQFLMGSYYKNRSLEELIGNYYAGPQAWARYGTAATDMGGGGAPSPNGTVQDYIDLVLDMEQRLTGLRPDQRAIVIGNRPAPVFGPDPGALDPGAGWDGWSAPLRDYTVSQEFGRNSFAETRYASGSHGGIDLVGPYGAAVLAAARGTVTGAGWQGGYGNAVTLDHGAGLESLYGHLDHVLVSVRQLVARGVALGIQGTTGNSTGDHLHFEIRRDGAALNPRDFLGFSNGGWLQEPVVGRGVRTGRIHTFNEDGEGELVLNRRQVGALAGRGGGGERDRFTIHAPITINVEHGDPREIERAAERAVTRVLRKFEDEWTAP